MVAQATAVRRVVPPLHFEYTPLVAAALLPLGATIPLARVLDRLRRPETRRVLRRLLEAGGA